MKDSTESEGENHQRPQVKDHKTTVLSLHRTIILSPLKTRPELRFHRRREKIATVPHLLRKPSLQPGIEEKGMP
jgi:hypothetical protein